MDSQQGEEDQNQRVSRAVDRLAATISLAPIEELRAPFEEKQGLNRKLDLEKINDSLFVLKERAWLGHQESIETLIRLGSDIASFLSEIAQSAEQNESPSLPESSSEGNEPEGDWRERIEDSVDTLLRLLDTEENQGRRRLDCRIERLPSPKYVFPLPRLDGLESFTVTQTEVTYLCDCLMQRRLNTERNRVLHYLSTHSLGWPLFVEAADYQSKKSLAECAPNLKLGTAIAPNLGVKPRREDSPATLVLPLFIGLEALRSVRRTEQELEDMRLSEERDEPAPLDQLIRENEKFYDWEKNGMFNDPNKLNSRIDELLKEFKEGLQKIGEFEKMRRQDEQNDLPVVSSLIDEKTRVTLKGLPEGQIWEKLRESRKEEEIELLDLLIEAKAASIRRSSWSLENIWIRKAALLPPLQNNKEVISQWAEAALAYIASIYDGNLQGQKWAPSIERRIRNKGLTHSGIKRFLIEGFETLAGKDRKS